jgi:hypothetical protein
MRLIKDIAPKPSDAIQAMIDGLLEQSERNDFKIDMGSFGGFKKGVCCGCAAVCCVQKLAGVDFKDEYSITLAGQSELSGFDSSDLDDFENAVDFLRMGYLLPFFAYWQMVPPDMFLVDEWYLHDEDWREQLPLIQNYCDKLKAAGL